MIRRDWRVFIPGAIRHYNWPKDTKLTTRWHRRIGRWQNIANFSVLSSLLHIQGRISGHEHPYNWLTGTNIKQTPC